MRHSLIAGVVLTLLVVPLFAWAQTAKLELEPRGTTLARVGYFPVRVALSHQKPQIVKKEPAYVTTPKYGVLRVGNGPRSAIAIAVDEPEGGEWRIYVDANANGDLTDDGDGKWSNRSDRNGRVMYGVNRYTVRASYGSAAKETSSVQYGIAVYRFADIPALLVYREAARTGTIALDGKQHKVLLIENDSDGLFSKPVGTVEEASKTRPVWLLVDINDDGKWGLGPLDIRAPFKLGEKVYEAVVAPDGSNLTLRPTTKAALDLSPKQPARPELLKPGTQAPDFVAEKAGGGDVKLSDYRGKTVILDFWATWCPPCQKSMPHLQEVHKAIQGKNAVILAVCVWDTKQAYDAWLETNKTKYSYQFAFDPAGRGTNSIAGKLFNVSGIPTTYIIDAQGRVAEAIVGYSDGDKRIEEALKKLGIELD